MATSLEQGWKRVANGLNIAVQQNRKEVEANVLEIQ